MAKISFGINGFGRIGRISCRVWYKEYRDQADLAMINTSGSMDLVDWAHLLEYDSVYGHFDHPVSVEIHQTKDQVSDEDPVLGWLKIGNSKIVVTAQRDPAKLPWKKYGVTAVIEATGVFRTAKKASGHLEAGAKQVLLSAPGKGGEIPMGVLGVNQLQPKNGLSSNASCTTNCVAPVAAIMEKEFGVKKALLTTIHSFTDDQNTHDNSHKDLRRARAASLNIIPTSTGAAKATGKVVPELDGKFDGLSIRVPTPVGSLSDMVFLVKRAVSVEEVNQAFIKASQSKHWQGILATTDRPVVSSDIIGRSESSIIDLSLTQVIDGDLVKVISWYDNEMGYCHRLVEQLIVVSG